MVRCVMSLLAHLMTIAVLCGSCQVFQMHQQPASQPVLVINTWPFVNATRAAFAALSRTGSALDAVEAGCLQAEADQSLESVSYGHHPDEAGNVTFDAMLMNGVTMEVGAVAAMPDILEAVSVARAVMERTGHTMLVGDRAADFAVEMGFKRRSLNTDRSAADWRQWRSGNCQPNFRRNVQPPADHSCGPYRPASSRDSNPGNRRLGHDTIGMVAMDAGGGLAVGTTTNGAAHRVPGRVGDTAVVGAGGYAKAGVGAAVGTGDGDILMRYLLAFAAVSEMSLGASPEAACRAALASVRPPPSGFHGALAAVDADGNVGGACIGFDSFQISVMRPGMPEPSLLPVPCSPGRPARL
uniref:N(4)-(Beta-N-acetylglucosaminyl)-L-asparaginase n=2 Tax=Macrostomum lignano TaxID=282301 RepID=A0A1I8HSC1_9PLAT